jgi:hypothetical protein
MVFILFVLPLFLPPARTQSIVGLAALELVLIGGVYSISGRRRTLMIAMALSVPGVIARWSGVASGTTELHVAGNLLLAAAMAYIVSVYVRTLLTSHEVDAELISAAVSGYLLLGLVWTALFEAMHELDPNCIAGAKGAFGEFAYFSFTTLTTLGYGDLAPVAPQARAAATAEAVAGQLYVAITIARLVALETGKHTSSRKKD